MKINARSRGQSGFTLIELIAVMILTSIGAIVVAMLIQTTFIAAAGNKSASEDSQIIQIAMNRLVRELTFAAAGTLSISDDGRTIDWVSNHADILGEARSVSWDGVPGSKLEFTAPGSTAIPMLKNISGFVATLSTESITFTIRSDRSEGIDHTMTIHPREGMVARIPGF